MPKQSTLAQAPMNKLVQVVDITEDDLKPKLLEMGFYSGKSVRLVFKAPFGDPIAVDLGGYLLSMRLDEAQLIQVEEIEE